MTIEKEPTGGQAPKDMINKLEQARLESERKAAEQKQKQALELSALTKEATDMATGNYRLNQKTSADMSRRRQWTSQGEDSGHTQAEFNEREQVARGNFDELSRAIYEQEIVANTLEQKIKETELILESHPDVEPTLVEARAELEKLRQTITDKKAERKKEQQSAGVKVRDIEAKWKRFGTEQEKAAQDSDAFAAEQMLKTRELAGTPSKVKPEELKSAVAEEARKRHREKVEKHESEVDALEMNVIREITEELKTAETEMMNDLNAQTAFLNGETPEGKEFLASFEQKKQLFETLKDKTFWFKKVQREKARYEELKKLVDEIKSGDVQIASKLTSVQNRLSDLLGKAWCGQEREVPKTPLVSHHYDETTLKKETAVLGAHSHKETSGGGNPYYSIKERAERIRGAREKLNKLGHELQNKISLKIQEVEKLLKEKIKLS